MKHFKMTIKTVLAATSLAVVGGMAVAEEIKLALNGKNDTASNSEAAYIEAFTAALADTDFTVAVFPSASVGKEKERLGQVSQGLLHVNLATASTPFSMSPFMKGIFLPFLFNGAGEFDRVMASSDLVERMNAQLAPNGVRLLGFNLRGLDAGLHNTEHPVTKMADMGDLRMRAMNNSQVAFYTALGAASTVVSWAEVANALQTGIAEGYMNAPNSSLRTGHSQFLKYYTAADIFPSIRAVLVSEDWYAALSDADRAAVDAANAAGLAANRAWVINWAGTVSAKFDEAGVTVSELEPGEREKFVTAAMTTWGDLVPEDVLAVYQAAIAAAK